LSFDHAGRVGRLQESMRDAGVDVTLLSVGADLPYFTGYEAMPSERLTVLVVPSVEVPVLFLPELEAPRVSPGRFEIRTWSEIDDPVALAAGAVPTPSRVAVGDHMWSVFLTRFQREWSGTDWGAASQLTAQLRMRKDQAEVDLLRAAAHAVDRVMARIPGEVRFVGRTEVEVARQLMEMTVGEGHDVAEFAIVASGPNGASPHHHPGSRTIVQGDMVVCDFGGRLGGYYSDSTRTFIVGEPTQLQREVHDLVAAANAVGREMAAPGVICADVDRAVRSVIDAEGHGDRFVHRTGHGIGLEVHEHPYIVEGNETPLEAGMAFSIEPGVYLEGDFGVRVEDIVVCTDTGVESLNTARRSIVTVD